MTIITEIKYILDPTKEYAACSALEEAMEKDRDEWDWEVSTTTTAYTYIKSRKVMVNYENRTL